MMTVKEQYRLHDEILKDRLENLMPALLAECGVEMWVVLSKEYNEDPVFRTLVPALVKNASRVTCLVFCRNKDGSYEALNVSRPNPRFDGYYKQAMNRKDDVFEALNHLIAKKKPAKVHVDISNECALADGLSKNLYDRLQTALCGQRAAGERGGDRHPLDRDAHRPRDGALSHDLQALHGRRGRGVLRGLH